MSPGLRGEVGMEYPPIRVPDPPSAGGCAFFQISDAVSPPAAPAGLSPSDAWPPGRHGPPWPSVPVPTATAAPTSPAPPGLSFTSHADGKGSPPQVAAVQGRNGRLRLFGGRHVHKSKAAWTSGDSICHDLDFEDLAATFLEQGAKLLRVHAERKVAHVHSRSHALFSFPPCCSAGLGDCSPCVYPYWVFRRRARVS